MTDDSIFALALIFIGDFGAKQCNTIPTRQTYIRFLICSRDSLSLVIPNNKTKEH